MDTAYATIASTATTWSEAVAASCLGETVKTADRLLQRGAGLAAGVIASGLMEPAGYQRLSSSQFEKSALTPSLSHFRKYTVDTRSADFVSEIPGLVNQFKNLHKHEDGPLKGLVSGDDGNPVIKYRRHVRVVLPLPASKAVDPMDILGLSRVSLAAARGREGEMDRELPITPPTDASRTNPWTLFAREATDANGSTGSCWDVATEASDTIVSTCGRALSTCGNITTLAALSALNSNWLYVMEFVIDHTLYHKIQEALRSVMGTGQKKAPAFIFGKVTVAIRGFIKASKRGNPTVEQYNYLVTVGHILALGFLLNTTYGDGRIVEVVLTEELDPEVEEEEGTPVVPLELDAIGEALNAVRKVCPHLSENVTPLIPATEFSGTKYEQIEVTLKEDELHHWLEVADDISTAGQHGAVGAATVGINLLGARPPNDTKHPISFASGFTRHLCAVSGEIPISATESVKYVIDKTLHGKPHADFYEVARGMADDDCKDFAAWLQKENISADIGNTMFSNSIGEEKSNAVLAEWYTTAMAAGKSSKAEFSKAILSGVFLKAGENSERARFVTMPGKNGTQDIHQVCAGRPVKLIEKFMKETHSHHHTKGLDVEGVNLHMGEWLWDMPEDHFVMSFDKKANDRTWSCHHYEVWVEYVHLMMAEVAKVCGNDWEFPWMNFQSDTFDMNIATTFFNATVDAVLWFLMSAVNPTSFFNRVHGECESGVVTKNVYGPEALVLWFKARRAGIASRIQEDFEGHFCSDRENTKSDYITKLRFDPAIGCPTKFTNEGDDKTESFKATAKLNTWAKMAQRVVKIGAEILKIALEPVLFMNPDARCKGKKAIVEFCSRGYMLELEDGDFEPKAALMCPKPVKNVQKMAWQVSQQFQYCKNEAGEIAIVQDSNFMRLCATRCLSIAEYNLGSPGVGPFILGHAQFYVDQCKAGAKTFFDDRSFEARHPEEAELGSHVNQLLEEWYCTLSQAYDRQENCTKGALFLSANLWQIEHLSMRELPIGELQAHLLRFDEQARDMPMLEVGWFYDPRHFLDMVDMAWAHKLVNAKYAVLEQHMLNATKLMPATNTYESFVARISEIVQPGKRKTPKVDPANAAAASTNGRNNVLSLSPIEAAGRGGWKGPGKAGHSGSNKRTTAKGENHEPAVPAPKGEAACARKEELKGAASSASAWIGKGSPIGARPNQAK